MHNIKILSISTDRRLFDKESAVLERHKDYAKKMEELHIIVFSLKKDNLQEKSLGNLHIYPTNSIWALLYVFDAFKIAKNILTKDFIISTQDPFETGLVGYLLKRKFNIPLQIQIHTDFLSPYFKNSFFNRIRVFISKFTIPKADGIRTVSSVINDSLDNEFTNLKAKIDILPIFVDIERYVTTNSNPVKDGFEFPRNILMVSRLAKEKRIDIGLEIFKKVLDMYKKDLSLTIIGNGLEKQNLEDKKIELNLGDEVSILEWENDVISAYKHADVFLLTSEYEGYGMTLIEAGASGCPIVTTEVGIAKTELFKNGVNSFVCPVGDVNCLAKSIIELISNQSKRNEFKSRMQEDIQRISISKEEYTERYINLLQKLL